jgi:hypothetical protein
MKTAIEKVTWVGRITVFAVGLTVVLAITVGLATTALAAVSGDPFNLGKTNTINTISQLVGNTATSMLRIDNNSTGSALQLLVEPGKAPLTVNEEAATVKNLSADELDGKDGSAFFSGNTYVVSRTGVDTALSAIYVPFGGTGAPPSSAAISAAREKAAAPETRERSRNP